MFYAPSQASMSSKLQMRKTNGDPASDKAKQRTLLERWRADPISFIEDVLHDPETRKPFVLLASERAFLEHAFQLNEQGRLLYSEQVYSCPKKSGKTTLAAMHALTLLLLFG